MAKDFRQGEVEVVANVDLGEGGVPRGSTVGQVDAPVLVSVLVRG